MRTSKRPWLDCRQVSRCCGPDACNHAPAVLTLMMGDRSASHIPIQFFCATSPADLRDQAFPSTRCDGRASDGLVATSTAEDRQLHSTTPLARLIVIKCFGRSRGGQSGPPPLEDLRK